jgi:RNA polymerase sigma-70 factor (ECF subfamily)
LNDRAPIRLVEASEPKRVADASDDELMLLARAGREDAFETLMRRHQAFVFGLSTRFMADRALGRDVMQDVFLALWRERGRYQANGRFRSYLAAMTLNRCHMVTRSRKSHDARATRSGQLDARPVELPIDVLVERERAREVRQLLARVPDHHREVLVMRFSEELELEEIARATGRPLGTVKSHLFRGLKALRALLKERSP